jgi:EAL domain-containing protein (putative c-di-GMP-specific phosphodiesterase class I)
VKIEGSFVREVLTDRGSQSTVRANVELARGYGVDTVAEYVEIQEIAELLRKLGVDYAQGYAFSKPAPLTEALDQIARDEAQAHDLFLNL